MRKLRLVLKSMRPRQWPKNIFIFAALGFDRQILHLDALLRTAGGFGLLCLASGAVYLVNDVADREQDRLHPDKRKRPIASGEVSAGLALAVAGVLGPLSIALGFVLHPALGWLVAGYLVLNLAYSFALKHVPIVDALAVAAGFVIRVAAGVTLIRVERFSPWLYVCTVLLALYISFGKRRAELALLVDEASNHRRVLDGYTIPLLDSYIQIVSGATIVAYSFYTFTAPNLPANHSMMLTIPFVVYSIFRYLYLVQVERAGGAPEEIILMDRPLQAGVVLWALAAMGILYLQR
jgi:4-hydroxybenzoate polyprenyltransferase